MISKRLDAILNNLHAEVLADIGCDHAYLCCEAVQQNRVKKAYACDVAEGPLQHARKTIEEYNLQGKVIPLLSDGFENVPEDTSLAVLAGMGALTIQQILEAGSYSGPLLLSPHKDASMLRRWLCEHGYRIEWEQWIHDGHDYPLIKAEPGQMELSPQEEEFGKNVRVDEDYLLYLKTIKRKYEALAQKIPPGKRGELLEKQDLLEKRLNQIMHNFERIKQL